MSHLFFNVFGACLWFVVPIMRNIPVGIAKFAARRTAKYRWWAVNYIIGFFFVFPILFFLLSLASSEAVTGLSTMEPLTGPGYFRSGDLLMCVLFRIFSVVPDRGTLCIDNCFDKYDSRDWMWKEMSSWISSFLEMAPSSVQISWTLWQILQLFLLRQTG